MTATPQARALKRAHRLESLVRRRVVVSGKPGQPPKYRRVWERRPDALPFKLWVRRLARSGDELAPVARAWMRRKGLGPRPPRAGWLPSRSGGGA